LWAADAIFIHASVAGLGEVHGAVPVPLAVQDIGVIVTTSSHEFEKATPLNVLETTRCTVKAPAEKLVAGGTGTTVMQGIVVTPLPTEPDGGVLALIVAFAVLLIIV
jgi:hypothetical protein